MFGTKKTTGQAGRSVAGAIRRRAVVLAAVTVLGALGAASLITPQRPTSGNEANDREATLGRSDGPVTLTGLGLPPADGRARARHAQAHSEDVPRPGNHHEIEDVENGEASYAGSTKQLIYHTGGAVQTSPRIYLVLWGSSWGTSAGDPYGEATRLHYFYAGLGGSSLANVLKQFGGSTGNFTNPTGQYKGWIQDKSFVPAYPTQTDIHNAAIRAANLLKDFSYNAQYIIATPWGVVDQYSTANNFCAWHNYTYVGTTGNWVTDTSLPYQPYMDYLGRGCGGNKVNAGSAGILDGATINAAHEYEESVNDPGLNAWYDADGSENADKCSWVNLANITLTNGYLFPVQPAWSNSYRTTYGNGCLYSS